MASNWTEITDVVGTTSAPNGTNGGALDPLDGLAEEAHGAALVFGLLAITLLVNNLLHKQHIPIPEAIATVVIGLIGGGFAKTNLFPSINTHVIERFEDMSARSFMIALIAPIIFAEGYGMKSRAFFQNMTRILSNAFIGTVISAIIVAVFLYYIPQHLGMSSKYSFTFAETFTFGILISATDPVTTLAIFKDQNMVENGLSHLYYSVLGESILNDAVAITLFDGCNHLVSVQHKKSFEMTDIAELAGNFCVTWFGSVALGVLCGLIAALLLKFGRLGGFSEEDHFHFNVPEMGVVIVLAYLPFLIAEATDILSPIVAVLFAGITMRHYAHYNLTIMTRQVFLPTIELIANLCETYAFLLLGLGVFLLSNDYSFPLIITAVVGCLVARAAFVYPFSYAQNCVSKAQPLTRKEMHVVWFAGLRGAVAFVCCLRFPENEESKNRNVFLCTTMVLVFLSMVLLGWPTAAVLKALDIKAPESALSEASRVQQCTESSTFCANLSAMMKNIFMAPDAREERLSAVRLSRARASAALSANGRMSAPDDNAANQRLSCATGLGADRLTAISQRLSAAGSQRPSAARTICDP